MKRSVSEDELEITAVPEEKLETNFDVRSGYRSFRERKRREMLIPPVSACAAS